MTDQGLVHSPSAHTQPDSANTVADILTAAANLTARGWMQGWFDNRRPGEPPTCFCAAGAIMAASGRHNIVEQSRAIVALEEVIGGYVFDWNDAPERTQAEVVSALRQAAEKARVADSIERPSVGISALSGNETQDHTKEGEG